MKNLIYIFLFLLVSCKTSYVIKNIDGESNLEFEKRIDETPDYFNLFILIDKSLNGTKISIERGSLSGKRLIYDNIVSFEKEEFDYKLIKVENTKNILVKIEDNFFSIEPNKYQNYRFLSIKKIKRKVYLIYSNKLPEGVIY